MTRSAALQEFVDSFKRGLNAAAPDPDVSAVADVVFAALAQPGPEGAPAPLRLPVCDCAAAGIELAKTKNARLATAFAALEPLLTWGMRATGGPFASANWPEGHANASIFGPSNALEIRSDVWVGVSLLAPHVRYPDHSHAPEEIYLLLTPGRFQHGDGDWFEPGAGGTLHNTPAIKHAMASDETPLLAIWALLLKPR